MRAALLVVFGVALAACQGEEPVTSEGYPERALERAESPAQPPPEPLYGDDGLLLESDRVIAGLPMPRGLELRHEGERRHVFHGELPPADLLRYFGPRLITGEVTQLGEGAVYRNGAPRGAKGAVVRLDVAVRPTHKGAQVEVFEIPPVPKDPPSRGELAETLERQHLQ